MVKDTKTALEAIVEQHTKDLDDIHETMKEMILSLNGLRSDMAERGAQMIAMLNSQSNILIKSQMDHEISDINRFSDVKTTMAYYIGGATAFAITISTGIAFAGVYWGGR